MQYTPRDTITPAEVTSTCEKKNQFYNLKLHLSEDVIQLVGQWKYLLNLNSVAKCFWAVLGLIYHTNSAKTP